MVKPLLTTVCLFFCLGQSFSQSDLLVMKQKNQVIQTWIPGSVINFQFSNKQWIEGIIKTIRNDSILMEQIVVRTIPDAFGFPRIDTAKLGLLKLHVNEIYGMPRRNFGGDIFSNGALFQLGSGAYIFLNIFNSLIHNEQVFSSVNLTRLGIAGGVFVIGSLLSASHKTYIVIGKKYHMQTIHTQ